MIHPPPGVGPATADGASAANGAYPVRPDFDLWTAIVRAGERAPGEAAIRSAEGEVGYRELLARANAWAGWLIGQGVGPDVPVGLCLDKSPAALTAILAVWRAGGAYVPLDPAYPRDRLAVMLADAEPRLILIAPETRGRLPDSAVGLVDIASLPADGPAPRPCVATDDDLGYVLFTSGSTGRPKGVAMRRGPLRRLIEWQTRHSCAGPGDATLQFASLSFDVSFQEIFSTWATGGTLVLPTEAERRDPAALVRLIDRADVRRLFVPFVMLQGIAEAAGTGAGGLRELITAGEQLQITPAVRRFFAERPGCTLHNHYGPTEAHVVTAQVLSGPPGDWPTLPPIGRPIDSAVIELISADSMRDGEGEICIGGECLARGYLGRPELTAERFIADPARPGGRLYRTGDLGRWNAAGELEYLGRIDRQVKIRGYRVEPGEVEAALCAHPGVAAAAVIDREDAPGDRRLVAYVVPKGPTGDLRAFVAGRLPEFMIPAAFVELERLPLTPSGKVDRAALPAPRGDRPALAVPFAEPATPVEKAIAAAWEEVLQVRPVGCDDPFFELGGHSLALARVHHRLAERIDLKLPLAALFQYPTVRALAAAVEGGAAARRDAARPTPGLREPIAIIGMAGRFPGAADVGEYWANLCRGVESITEFTAEQLRAAGIPDELIARPDYARARGILEGADRFDAGFFGLPPREAELTDPQQRLFLETAWSALEHAGYVPESCPGRVGVFAGSSMNTYLLGHVLANPDAAREFLREFQSAGYPILVGNDKDYLATRVAYKLNLRGPAVSVQTACSTSLVAVCTAVETLRSGRCDVALAGGVSVSFPQVRGAVYQDGAITSPDGHCRPFSADARGTVFGEGVGIVVLKRLSDAIADRDTVYAVIRGVGLSNDGADKLSYLAPGLEGQAEAVAAAYDDAGFPPDSVGYIEAHGTGTPMGDPIEVAALARVFAGAPAGRCRLGSVKANIGHLEAAAGVAGLIKATLAVHHRMIPATLHVREPNPELHLDRTPFRLPQVAEPWDETGPRRAGVTSLGVGGTNAHVALEEAPAPAPGGAAWAEQLFVVSARSAAAVGLASRELAEFLQANPGVDLADAAYTLQVGRRSFPFRRMVVAADRGTLIQRLRSDEHATGPMTARTPIAFVFPGQGAQATGMARGLYESEPTFRAALDHVAELLQGPAGFDVRELIFGADADRLNQTAVTQPALFAVEYALAQMWLGWGVRPDAMFGHSIGEYVAATLAGVFRLDDAATLVARRGQLIQACPTGVMLAVRAAEADVRGMLPPGVDVAAVNGPGQTVVSGPDGLIAAFEQTLKQRDVSARRLVTSHAFHSALLDPAVEPFREVVAGVRLCPPSLPVYSCVTGRPLTGEEATDPGYWARQLREPVRCADALRGLAADRPVVVLEVGPGSTLATLARGAIPSGRLAESIPGLPRDGETGDRTAVLTALGRLWAAGAEVDWRQFHALGPRRRIGLPTYPFERQRYFIDAPGRETEAQRPPAPASPAAAGTDLLPAVRALFAELAGVDLAALDADTSFYDVGFDSLLLTQAAQAVYARFGVRVAFRQLLDDLSTPGALAAWLARQSPDAKPVTPAVPAEPMKPEAPAGWGAIVPADQGELTDWSERQLDYLRRFIARYTGKTARSKEHVQQFRAVHADPRTVSGFTRLWKEMVYPLVVDRSLGGRIWDIDNNEYIDLLNGFGPDLLGHSPPFVTAAVERQLRAGYEVGPTSPLAGELAALICELTGLDRASFVCTGSEAVQAALRAARTTTGRDKVVTFARDYHGNFDEVLLRPVGGTKPATPSAPGVPRSAVGNVTVLDYGTAESLDVIRRLGPELAAVLVEPVQSRRPEWQPRDFLKELRTITEECGAGLIFDEVITGFRLHPGGAQAYYGIRADLATYGKVVGGGMPIGVVAGRSRWMDCFDGGFWRFGDSSIPEAGRTFFAGTFVRHPLALAAGIAALTHLQQQGPALQRQLNARGDRLVAELNAIARSNGVPLEIVNCGSLMFFRNLGASKEGSLLFYLLRERGVFLLEGFPSYISAGHADADMAAVVAAFRDSVAEMKAHGFFGGGPVETPTPGAAGLTPLTEAQRELWLAAEAGDDASRAFNETCTLRFHGPFDAARFTDAVHRLVARHDALRAVFDPSGGGQRFLDELKLEIPVVDLSALGGADRDARLLRLQDDADRHVFDLAAGPLLRVTIVNLADDDHAIVLTVHHIACDGWSYDVILNELGRLYSGETPPAAPSFAAYARRQAGRTAPDLPWWKARFDPPPAPIDLPADAARPAHRTYRGERLSRPMGPDLTGRVRQLAARIGCTPYAVLLAAFQSLVHRLTGQTDLVVGIPVAGQTEEGRQGLVGHCVHFLPLRQSVDGDQPFGEFAHAVKATLLDAFEHQDFTYVSLLRALPDLEADRPLIAVGFNVDPPLRGLNFEGLTASVTKNPRHFVNLELHWNLVDLHSDIVIEAEFNTGLFAAASVERWMAGYCELLTAACDSATVAVGDLPVEPAELTTRSLVEWNATAAAIPDEGVAELFARQAAARPDAVAVIDGEVALTYAELDRRAERLADELAARGIGPDVPVAVALPRGADLVVALLGVMKSGGAYLPLDLTHPPARNAGLIRQAGAPVVIAADAVAATLGVPAVRVDASGPAADKRIQRRSAPSDLAAVLYTSGSTGEPKGVMVTHGGIVRLLINAHYAEFGPERTHALLAPVAFDAATFEIWGALLHGGRLAIYPDAVPDIDRLGAFLKAHGVDTLWLTAGLFNAVIDRDPGALTGVRQLLTGGEALSVGHVRRALEALPGTRLINGYGPTEVTTFACTYEIPQDFPADAASVPIGRPIANTTALVLDRRGRPAPVGVVGELVLGGPGVARGYIRRPELTAERFVPSPVAEVSGVVYRTGDRVRWRADGLLEFFGRADRQVKIRGHRIEPGEIEAALTAGEGVRTAAVEVRGTGSGARLVAYVVADRRDPDLLRRSLLERLPAYLIPAAFVFLDALPLTPNGKLDRSALPEPESEPSTPRDRLPPRTDAERDVLRVWADVLRQSDVSVTDDFFMLGGHSLTAVELVAAIRDRLGHSVPLSALYQAPTVEKFAAVIQNRLEAGSERSLVPLQVDGTRPAMFLIAGVGGHVFAFHKFARLLGPDQPCYGVKAIGVDGVRATPERIEEIASEYVDEIVAARPAGPCVLGGYSIGAVIALEVALQLRARGRDVPLLITFDAAAPGYMDFSLLKRARLHLMNLFVRGGGWRYLRQRLVNLRDKLNWATGRGHRNAPEVAGLEMFSQDAITRVWVALHKAYKAYKPARKFDGAIDVVRAEVLEDWDKFVSDDPFMGWSRWTTGPISDHGLQSRHLDLFHEPAIYDVARIVGASVAKASGRG